MYRIGIDVGGTFTDLVAVDDTGGVTFAKAPSTPADQSVGVMDGLGRLAVALNSDLASLLAQTTRIVHGTTVATNALLERKGAKVGLLTTEGHRDVLEMREGLKPDRYNMRMARAEPLIPRDRRLGVRERIRPEGTVEVALDPASVAAAVEVLKAKGCDSVAICYLHAYKDPAHEQATAAIVREQLPGAYVCLSSDVFPQIKEYERVSTTAVNAYVGPVLDRYLSRLEQRLQEAGYGGPVLIILSHGGVAPIAEAIRLAAATVLSGPAGGVAGARYASRLMEAPNLIPFDMGGTSTDISLISGGEPTLSADRGIADQRIALQALDIASIGAGGGSLASVDAGGRAGLFRPCQLSRRQHPPGCAGGGGGARPVGRRTRRRARAGGGRRAPGHQHANGGGRAPGLGAPRHRPAPVRAAVVRRRCRPARDGGRPAVGRHPGHRAPRRQRAVGLGHAGDRPAVRGEPDPYWRHRRA